MTLKILPFEKKLFENFSVEKQNISTNTYITSVKLINKLLVSQLPIRKKKAILRILNFLTFCDIHSNEKGILTIPKKILEDFFTRTHYVKYMKLLSKLNVVHKIKTNGSYYRFEGERIHATKYKLHKEYMNDSELAFVVLEEEKQKVRNFVCEVDDLDDRFKNTIKNIDLKIPQAISAEIKYWDKEKLKMSQLRQRISRILSTLRNRKIKKGQKVNRIYHSFSNLSRISRAYFNFKFYNIDIVNSQPLLLVAYLKQNNFEVDTAYQVDCENGLFYERFYYLSEEDIDDKRREVKQSLYQNIFFGFNKKSKYNKLFRDLYPNTWDSLEEISNTNISLASRLQNIEAMLFNKLTPKYSTYYYTLFDAVYFTNSADKILLEREIEKFFKKLKIKVKTK